jgi:lantibiotic modifying enzyme
MSSPLPPLARAASGWRPLLTGEEAERALTTAEEIAAAIGRPPALPTSAASGFWRRDYRDFSLADGRAGIAVFLSYLEVARPGRGYGEWALWQLGEAVAGTARVVSPPRLYSGFPGVAWALEHLAGRLYEVDGEDAGEEVARTLAELLGEAPWDRPVELVGGAAGLGVYALERLGRPHGEQCLRRTIERLAEVAERRGDGITWWTPASWLTSGDRERFPAGRYTLGVSHGVPGVIAFLGEAAAALDSAAAWTLLRGAVAWLCAQKLPAGSPSTFPNAVAPGATPAPTRLSWCYGDLGISLALLGAARRAGEREWEAEALALARGSAVRRFEVSGVVDPCLCHGAAGAAHLFNRLFQATGEPLFAAAARGWIERTYALRRAEGARAGFMAWLPGESGGYEWLDDPGLLTGAAGVGLALLAAATAIEPAWDRILLVSVPS